MIYESYPYYEAITHYAERYQAIDLSNFSDDEEEYFLFELERDTFYTAFVIRKLIECGKIADSFSDIKITLPFFKAFDRGKGQHLHNLEKHYDFYTSNRQEETRNINYICDQLIHSKIFVFMTGALEEKKQPENTLLGFFLNSDKTYKHKIYEISWKKWIQIINSVAKYHVDTSSWHIQEDGTEITKRFNSEMDRETNEYKKNQSGLLKYPN